MSAYTSRIGVSIPMLDQPYPKLSELAALADEAEFESVWDYEIYRNPFIAHAVNACATRRIKLATGVAAAAGRSPFEMANAAADIDELSGGRAILGLSAGEVGWADTYNGADADHPLSRLREYITIVRMVWRHLNDGGPAHFQGRFYKFDTPEYNSWGVRHLTRPSIPIYVGCVKPRMLQMAGELADGVITYFTTPQFITEHILPNIAQGARKAGRDPAQTDLAALVVCSVSDDRDEAIRRARINVGHYAAFPPSSPQIEFAGLEDDRDYVVKKLLEDGPSSLETATSDELLRTFAIAGTPEEAREQLAELDGVLPHIVLHPPNVLPLNRTDSEEAFRAIIRTFTL